MWGPQLGSPDYQRENRLSCHVFGIAEPGTCSSAPTLVVT